MKALVAITASLLIISCSSSSSTKAASSGAEAETGRSKFEDTLPATDLGAADASAAETDSALPSELVLQEEVIFSASDSRAAGDGGPLDTESLSQQSAPAPEVQVDIDRLFTLQLAALKSMEKAVEYAEKHGIEAEQAGVARVLSNEQIWYVLAYGVYQSMAEAERAKSGLVDRGVPPPWIRTLGTLERLSKEAKGVADSE